VRGGGCACASGGPTGGLWLGAAVLGAALRRRGPRAAAKRGR
jgi:MYXO-CTERM domain-containing protein